MLRIVIISLSTIHLASYPMLTDVHLLLLTFRWKIELAKLSNDIHADLFQILNQNATIPTLKWESFKLLIKSHCWSGILG